MFYFFALIYGLILGSFAGVCMVRIPKKQPVILGKSNCDNCHQPLKWRDMIPVISFTVLRGRCRYCHHKIRKSYFILEIFFSCFTLFICLYEEQVLKNMFQIGLVLLLLILSFIDVKKQIVPNCSHVIIPLFALLRYQGIGFHLKGFLILFIPLFILGSLVEDGIGGGDIKLFGSLGFVLGWRGILVVFSCAIFLALPVAIFLKYWKDEKGLPFVPFIAMATFVYFYLPFGFLGY